MPETLTRDFGPVTYSPEEVFHFPLGLPGFTACRRFLTLRPQPAQPLVVLQSLDQVEVAFLTLPVGMLVMDYALQLVEQDRRVLGPHVEGWHLLAMLSLPASGLATANLLGPLVLDPATRTGVQAIREDRRYGAAEPLDALLSAAAASMPAAPAPLPVNPVVRQPEALCS